MIVWKVISTPGQADSQKVSRDLVLFDLKDQQIKNNPDPTHC